MQFKTLHFAVVFLENVGSFQELRERLLIRSWFAHLFTHRSVFHRRSHPLPILSELGIAYSNASPKPTRRVPGSPQTESDHSRNRANRPSLGQGCYLAIVYRRVILRENLIEEKLRHQARVEPRVIGN